MGFSRQEYWSGLLFPSPLVMYGCESCTIKKVEHPRIDTLELWCWRRFLRVPWTARRSVNPKGNQAWIFIGRTGVEAEAPILWPPDAKSQLIGKDPDAGQDWGQEEKGTTGWDAWMASLTQGTWIWANSGRWWRTGKPGVLQFMRSQRVGHDLVIEQQQNTKVRIMAVSGA